MMNHPGNIILLGSGETSPVGGRVFETLVQGLPERPLISILETPAGFELNSPKVAGRVGAFLETRLQNYRPAVHIIPARKKGTAFSPDDAGILEPLLSSNILYMGAGSPTYAVRQLQGSMAWEMVRARHARGASIVLASAAIIAAGVKAVPVYEIFKVGQDPYWADGLDLLGPYGLHLVFVPHWNNAEGGADLDTSRCFLGRERFEPLLAGLAPELCVVGVDELTALTIDLSQGRGEVGGQGSVHLLAGGREETIPAGQSFPLDKLGGYRPVVGRLPEVSPKTWELVLEAEAKAKNTSPAIAPDEVTRLVHERQSARKQKDWQRADNLRTEIENAGWQVNDTPSGPQLEPLERN